MQPIPAWLDREQYPFDNHFIGLSAGALHYADVGSGAAVLLVHGTPSWSFEYRQVIRALSRTHRVIAPDLLGFGLSERPRDFQYTPEAHAAVLAEFVRALGLERFALVVHDFGGPIGLPLALERPERITHLAVLNSFFGPIDEDVKLARAAKWMSGWLGKLLYRYFNASLRFLMPNGFGERKKLTRALHAQYLAPFPDADSRERVLFALARSFHGSRDFFASLWARRAVLAQIPALLAWGGADPGFGPFHLARFQQALPQARTLVLPEAGHWPHEERPEAVISALGALLASETHAPPEPARSQPGHAAAPY